MITAGILVITGVILLLVAEITLIGGWTILKQFLKEEGVSSAVHLSVILGAMLLLITISGEWHDGLWYPFYMDYNHSIWRFIAQ